MWNTCLCVEFRLKFDYRFHFIVDDVESLHTDLNRVHVSIPPSHHENHLIEWHYNAVSS